jgi:hypothetical protein
MLRGRRQKYCETKILRWFARITDKKSALLRHRHTFLLFEDHRETRALIAKYLRKSRYFAFMPLQLAARSPNRRVSLKILQQASQTSKTANA